MRKIFRPADFIFILFLTLVLALPSAANTHSLYLAGLIAITQAIFVGRRIFGKNPEKIIALGDALLIVYIFLLLWELATSKFAWLDKFLYPTPGVVIKLFIEDMPNLLKGLASSAGLLIGGFSLALATAIPLGLYFGYKRRLKLAAKPFAKILGPIPPIVYIPYAIAVLPTFRAASTFIIFLGAFWPIFINTLNGVSDIDKKIMDSARMLNLSDRRMLLNVILPGSISSIMSGATIGLSFSFILLTSAEMIGATIGTGWYVKYFSDFADYPRVIVGIIFIGIVVTIITFFFDKLERYLLRWRKN
ncbi:MAG: ABC transporter permease subunit [Candidatus Fibromonas sp.]|jgi:NitT/TauT family transport system permease protein|nr:ABC transporter permease subunit [Candidatus Fibromonas sp.]